MIVKAQENLQEKLLEYGVLSLIPLAATSLIGLFARNLDAARAQQVAQIGPGFLAVLIVVVMWSLPRIKSRRFKSGLSLQPSGVVRPEGYHLEIGRVLIYGTLLFFAGTQILSFVAGILLGLVLPASGIDPNSETFIYALLPTLIFGQAITAFLVSQWIGSRVHRHGLLTMLAVLTVGRILLVAVDSLLGFRVPIDAAFIVYFLMLTIVLWAIGGLGYWRGTKMREAGYVWYLLSNLPQESRVPLEELLYDEVRAKVGAEA